MSWTDCSKGFAMRITVEEEEEEEEEVEEQGARVSE